MDSKKYCAQIVKKSGSNFAASFLFLDKEQRRAMNAVYAFSRVVDDVADTGWEEIVAKKQLDFWRKEVALCFDGKNSLHPLTIELAWSIRQFKIPREYLDGLLDGVTMDLVKTRYATFDELKDYCYHVASVVGLICLRIFRVPDVGVTKDAAVALGYALQLTNIIRDVGVDSVRGRIYLPTEDLERFHVSEGSIFERRLTPEYQELLAFEWERANAFFEVAWRGFDPALRRKLLPAVIMGEVYFRLLQKIKEQKYKTLDKKIRVPKPEKLWIILKAILRSK